MELAEHKYFAISLPGFIVQFKNACLSYVIPSIDSAILYIEKIDSPLIFILLILIFVQLIRTAFMKSPAQTINEINSSENKQINKEIKDLKKELKSIQTMLAQLKSLGPEGGQKVAGGRQQTSRIINLCKDAWQKRETIATEIMDWQLKIIKEVTKLKNKSRSPRSPSKISSTQLNPTSKKSVNSMILPSEQESSALLRPTAVSEIKEKQEVWTTTFEEKEKPQPSISEEKVINIKLESESKKESAFPSINIQLHQIKKEQNQTVEQRYESVLINNNASIRYQLTSQKKVQQIQPSTEEPQLSQHQPIQSSTPTTVFIPPKPPVGKKPVAKRAPPPPRSILPK